MEKDAKVVQEIKAIVECMTPVVTEIVMGDKSDPITLEFSKGDFQRIRHGRVVTRS